MIPEESAINIHNSSFCHLCSWAFRSAASLFLSHKCHSRFFLFYFLYSWLNHIWCIICREKLSMSISLKRWLIQKCKKKVLHNYPFESIQGERVFVVVVSADVFKRLSACNEIHSLNIQSLWFYSVLWIETLSNNSSWVRKWKDKKILKWMHLIYMLMQSILYKNKSCNLNICLHNFQEQYVLTAQYSSHLGPQNRPNAAWECSPPPSVYW